MTDKEQIIVNGIDVGECEDVTGLKYCDGYGDWCYLYPDCSFKKLARKTQECENLKAEEKYLKQCCEKAGEELAKHSFGYDGKEKNLVVQAMELNEKYEKLIDQNASLQKQVEDMIKWQKTVAKLFDRTCRCQFLDEETAICKENGKECISIVGCRDRYRKEYEELKYELDLYKTWYRAKHDDVKNTLGRYRKALDKIEEYCDEQISLTGDLPLPFRTTESDILDIINKVKGDK